MTADIKFTKLEENNQNNCRKNTISILPYITPVATGVAEIIYGFIYYYMQYKYSHLADYRWYNYYYRVVFGGKKYKNTMGNYCCASTAGVISIWGVCSKSQVSPSLVWVFAAAVIIPRPFILAGVAIIK